MQPCPSGEERGCKGQAEGYHPGCTNEAQRRAEVRGNGLTRAGGGALSGDAEIAEPSLKKAALGEAHRVRPADDDVIEHAHIDKRQRIGQAAGQHPVGPGGLRYARGMIVDHDQRRGIATERRLDDFTGMDARPVDGAEEQFGVFDQPVAVIEEGQGENLGLAGGKLGDEEIAGGLRIGEMLGALEAPAEDLPGAGEQLFGGGGPVGDVAPFGVGNPEGRKRQVVLMGHVKSPRVVERREGV